MAVTTGLESPEWGGFDPARTRGHGPRDTWRSFRTAARLGWQMEANWTDPLLFFIYSVAKPLSAAFILVVMLDIIAGGADPAYRAFVVVGTALWAIVMGGIAGPAWAILDDRERYRMLKWEIGTLDAGSSIQVRARMQVGDGLLSQNQAAPNAAAGN